MYTSDMIKSLERPPFSSDHFFSKPIPLHFQACGPLSKDHPFYKTNFGCFLTVVLKEEFHCAQFYYVLYSIFIYIFVYLFMFYQTAQAFFFKTDLISLQKTVKSARYINIIYVICVRVYTELFPFTT